MRILIFTALLFVSQTTFSQIEKGSWLLDFNGTTIYDYEVDYTFPQLYFTLGYLPTDYLAVGVKYGGKGFLTDGRNRGTSLYSVFGRYYMNPSSENFHFFGQLEGGVLAEYLQDAETFSRWYFAPSAGMSYEVSPGLGFEIGLGITFMENLNTGQLRYENLSFTLGWMATISERSRIALEESERLFGRGSITLSAGSTLNNSFNQGLGNTLGFSETELKADAINISNSSGERGSVSKFDIGVGFFLSDRTVFNIGLGIVNFSEMGVSNATTVFAIAPGLRYYIPLRSERLLLFAQGNYEFGGINLSGFGTETTYQFYAGGAGVNYFIGPSIALEVGTDFGRLSWDEDDEKPYMFNVFYGLRLFF